MSSSHSDSFNQNAYDRWSEFYDSYPNPTVAIDELSFPSYWAHLKGKRVLEIGCGTGRHTQKLVRQENEVWGLDFSPGMLKSARAKLDGTSVRLLEGEFLSYSSLPESYFDAALSALVIEHIEKVLPFLLKLKRVLSPGGMVFLSEIHPSRALANSTAHFVDPDTRKEVRLESHVHREAEFHEAIDQSGLQLVQKSEICGTAALATLNPRWSKYTGLPMLQIWVLENRGKTT